MLVRLLRLLIGIVLIITSPITFLPSLVIWVFTKRFYLMDVFYWCVVGEWN